jgi:hypothetical protein
MQTDLAFDVMLFSTYVQVKEHNVYTTAYEECRLL